MLELLGAIGVGAAVVLTFINVIRDPLDPGHKWPNSLIDGLALVVGVAYAVGWGIDLVPQAFALVPRLAATARINGVAGQVLSGLTFGAAATFGAKFFNALGAFQASRQASAKALNEGRTT